MTIDRKTDLVERLARAVLGLPPDAEMLTTVIAFAATMCTHFGLTQAEAVHAMRLAMAPDAAPVARGQA